MKMKDFFSWKFGPKTWVCVILGKIWYIPQAVLYTPWVFYNYPSVLNPFAFSTQFPPPPPLWQQASISMSLFFFSFVLIFTVLFFPSPFSALIFPSPQPSPHCCPCPWVLFPFSSTLPPLTFPCAAPRSCHPALHLWFCLCLICFYVVCSFILFFRFHI